MIRYLLTLLFWVNVFLLYINIEIFGGISNHMDMGNGLAHGCVVD